MCKTTIRKNHLKFAHACGKWANENEHKTGMTFSDGGMARFNLKTHDTTSKMELHHWSKRLFITQMVVGI